MNLTDTVIIANVDGVVTLPTRLLSYLLTNLIV
jgi:hypothetical protein